MYKFFIALFIFCCQMGLAQNVDLIGKIADLQTQNDTFYKDGLFASQRFLSNGKNPKEDNTIYFTALIAYTLHALQDSFPASENKQIDTLLNKATSNYFRYKNRKGDLSYNFWQTHPEEPFPNANFLSKRDKLKLPDDVDVTSIIYLSKSNAQKEDSCLKQKMMLHASTPKIKSIEKKYRKYQAYTTWFGDKMPQELDICVMTNALLFVFQKGLEINKIDEQTAALIKEMILNNDHLKQPNLISPYYPSSALILYHVARLIAAANTPLLNDLREKVIGDIKSQLQGRKNEMEKVILLTSLYRLNEKIDFKINLKQTEMDFEDFYWFSGNFTSGKNIGLKKLFGKSNFMEFNYKCDAYYWTLLLELQTVSKTNFE